MPIASPTRTAGQTHFRRHAYATSPEQVRPSVASIPNGRVEHLQMRPSTSEHPPTAG